MDYRFAECLPFAIGLIILAFDKEPRGSKFFSLQRTVRPNKLDRLSLEKNQTLHKMVQLGFNEADSFKSSSKLIY